MYGRLSRGASMCDLPGSAPRRLGGGLGQLEEDLPGRVEDVDLVAGGVVRPGPVRHSGWYDHDHPGAQDAALPGEVELQLALEHNRDLLLRVGVDGGLGVGTEPDEAGHELVAHHRAE